MPQNIVFHLGLHKTATTTLQLDLFPRLSEAHYIGRQFPADPQRPIDQVIDALTCTDPIYFDAESVRARLEACSDPGKLNLVSHELLSGPLWAGIGQHGLDHRSAILQNIKACCPDARILLVLRRQDRWAKSVYRQYVVAGGVERSTALFEGERPIFPMNRFRYAPYVSALKELFPRGVMVLFFEQFMREREAFLGQLGDFLETPIPDVPLRAKNSANVGPTGMHLSRFLNHFFRGRINSAAPIPAIPRRSKGRWQREGLVSLLHKAWPESSAGTALSAMDARVFDGVLTRCRDDNRELATALGVDLSPYGYY
ncbi:MAG: hypothetical protein AAFY29_15845 [Pseudomonadota bacterium]